MAHKAASYTLSKAFLKSKKTLIQVLLMLKTLFTQESKVEALFCGTSYDSEPNLFFRSYFFSLWFKLIRGWSGGAMVLGKLPVPGRPTIRITVGQGPTALAVGAGGGCLDMFTLIYPFLPLSPSLWETA